jgi:hypothetical protein
VYCSASIAWHLFGSSYRPWWILHRFSCRVWSVFFFFCVVSVWFLSFAIEPKRVDEWIKRVAVLGRFWMCWVSCIWNWLIRVGVVACRNHQEESQFAEQRGQMQWRSLHWRLATTNKRSSPCRSDFLCFVTASNKLLHPPSWLYLLFLLRYDFGLRFIARAILSFFFFCFFFCRFRLLVCLRLRCLVCSQSLPKVITSYVRQVWPSLAYCLVHNYTCGKISSHLFGPHMSSTQ